MRITCDICMDLMPLVHDGVASADSVAAVEEHVESCAQCRALYEGQLPVPDHSGTRIEELRKKLRFLQSRTAIRAVRGVGYVLEDGHD